MKRWLLTWAIENRDQSNSFFSEVIEGDNWESHVAKTIRRQQPSEDGRFVSRWRLVALIEMRAPGDESSDRLKKVIDFYES